MRQAVAYLVDGGISDVLAEGQVDVPERGHLLDQVDHSLVSDVHALRERDLS